MVEDRLPRPLQSENDLNFYMWGGNGVRFPAVGVVVTLSRGVTRRKWAEIDRCTMLLHLAAPRKGLGLESRNSWDALDHRTEPRSR